MSNSRLVNPADPTGYWATYLRTIRTVTPTGTSAPVPQMFESYDQSIYVTVTSFSGGTVPTLTGTVQARGVFGS